MSGGRLVVLDRSGRPTKSFELPSGLATLGSGAHCDICFIPSTYVEHHHASIVVHANQTIIRNVGDGETLVNGRAVSVAALAHGDIINVGGRALRWEYYTPPPPVSPSAPSQHALYVRGARSRRAARRASGPAAAAPRDPALRLALELNSRASAPGGSSKQVAIVQPQRRDTSERHDTNSSSTAMSSRPNIQRARTSRNEQQSFTQSSSDTSRRATTTRISLRSSPNLQNMTKATLWIESRKPQRKSAKTSFQTPTPKRVSSKIKKRTPLRTVSLKNTLTPNRNIALRRKSHSAQKTKVTKIEAPLKIDHTKQAALMLMTGHTPKSKLPISIKGSAKKSPSYVAKKTGLVKTTPRSVNSGRRSRESGAPTDIEMTPKSISIGGTPKRHRGRPRGSTSKKSSSRSGSKSITILEVKDSAGQRSTISESNTTTRSLIVSPRRSHSLPSAKKSALKGPGAKKNSRKTDSIKFDLSNLECHTHDDPTVTNTAIEHSYDDESMREEKLTLHYDSDTTVTKSPSPRRAIHSRSSRILEKILGTSVIRSSTLTRSSTLSTSVSQTSRGKKYSRASKILQRTLENSKNNDLSAPGTSRLLTPRSTRNMETYSIVDLVSIDTDETRSPSMYDSADSSVVTFGTPAPTVRRTRSSINLLGSSTPYTDKSASTSITSKRTKNSKELTTPEGAQRPISVNSTRISRITRSRSRMDDGTTPFAVSVLDDETEDSSPKSSKKSVQRKGRSASFPSSGRRRNMNISVGNSLIQNDGDGEITPENRHSPVEPTTPVLSIQNLLNSSQKSSTSRSKKAKIFLDQRKTTNAMVLRSGTKKSQATFKSKSLSLSAKKIILSKNNKGAARSEEKIVTPKSTVKLVQEAVKNKHSSAKRPLSKRSIIDTLNESDLIKQLFNSPVKRKLSQSMKEFSRKRLFDDEDVIPTKRPTRNTIAVAGRSPLKDTLVDPSVNYTTDMFVSPLTSPDHSLNLDGVKRLFEKNTPENDLRDVRGVKALFQLSPPIRSAENDLTNVTGLKTVFTTSPQNRLSDVRGIKELFARSAKNDLTGVSGVKSLFRRSRKSKPTAKYSPNIEGVKSLFNLRIPRNDLRNVSVVNRIMRDTSPRNNLSDVSGVKQLYAREATTQVSNLNESTSRVPDCDSLFNQLIDKPPIKATYSKSFTAKSLGKSNQDIKEYRPFGRSGKKRASAPVSVSTNNIELWLDQEWKKRPHAHNTVEHANKRDENESNVTIASGAPMIRELQNLATDTVDGCTPIYDSRVRSGTNKSVDKDQHSLPLKKRSLTNSFKNREAERSPKRLPIKKRSLTKSFEKRQAERSPKRLPIKKRALISSTPLQNKHFNWTAEVSALGGMSPISDHNRTAAVHAPTQRRRQANRSCKAKGAPSTRVTRTIDTGNATLTISNSIQLSPRKVRASKLKALTDMVRVKLTRSRNINQHLGSQVTNKRKGRASLIIIKKNTVLSPRPTSGVKQISTTENWKENLLNGIEPRALRTRGRAQGKVIEKPVTPKVTRRRIAQKATLSPKPSSSKHIASPETKSTRRQPRKLKSNTRMTAKVDQPSLVVIKPSPRPKSRPAREHKPDINTSQLNRTRKVIENVKDFIAEEPIKRGRKINVATSRIDPEPKVSKPKRGKMLKNLIQDEANKATKPRRTRNHVTENTENVKQNTRTRKVESANNIQLQARRALPANDTTARGRKRRAAVHDNPVPSKVTKTSDNFDIKLSSRTRKPKLTADTKSQSAKLKRSVVKDTEVETNKRTLKNKHANNVSSRENSNTGKKKREVSERKPTRAGRATAMAAESSRGGARKRSAVTSPAKASVKVARRGRKKVAQASPAPVASPAPPVDSGRARRMQRTQPDVEPRATRRRR